MEECDSDDFVSPLSTNRQNIIGLASYTGPGGEDGEVQEVCDNRHNFNQESELVELEEAGKTCISLSFVPRQEWTHPEELIKILEEANQEISDELLSKATRF